MVNAVKSNLTRNVTFIELGKGEEKTLLKIGSSPLCVWEDFESLSDEHNAQSIVNNSLMNFAKITRDALKLNLKHYNPFVDVSWLHKELSNLTEKELINYWAMITDIDKYLATHLTEFTPLTNEEKESLKKKKIL